MDWRWWAENGLPEESSQLVGLCVSRCNEGLEGGGRLAARHKFAGRTAPPISGIPAPQILALQVRKPRDFVLAGVAYEPRHSPAEKLTLRVVSS